MLWGRQGVPLTKAKPGGSLIEAPSAPNIYTIPKYPYKIFYESPWLGKELVKINDPVYTIPYWIIYYICQNQIIMSEKTTIFAIHIYEDDGVEIEIALEKGNINPVTLIGLLEQVKFDMLKGQMVNTIEQSKTKYDA
jgi:hypothetical protein